MSDFMGIVEMIDAQLLRRHNNTATEFFEAGQQAEQERIIKLLEKHRNDFSVNRGFGEIENLADDVIALIKGEK